MLAIVAWLGIGLAGCGSSDEGGTLAAIHERGEIVYGADVAGGEPYIYEDPGDSSHLLGFEVEIMDGIAKRLGVKARMSQHTWENLVPSLERGDFDIVMNGLEATPDRRARLRLSKPYFVYAETLAVRRGATYKTLDDLDGKSVGTLDETVAFDMLRDHKKIDTKGYQGNIEPYLDLENGRIEAVLLDNIIAYRYGCTSQHPTIVCQPDDIARGEYVIAARQSDPELQAAINDALDDMKKTGELEKILRRNGLWDTRQTEPAPSDVGKTREVDFDGEQMQLFLEGAAYTLGISVASFLIAVVLGVLLAVGRLYGDPVTRGLTRAYIELFRGTPVLLQLYVMYFGVGARFHLDATTSSVLALGLNYAAYEAEVYRGALGAIPRGQTEASKALGMGTWQTLWHVLLPQGFRIALPPMTNDFVSLLKDSSLVGVIAVIELTKRTQILAFDMHSWVVPGIACAVLYMAMSFPLSELARRLERRLSRDQRASTL